MALDPQYVLAGDLEGIFVNKDTGLPLSNGYIKFWEDDNRTNPKPVYELSGAPPNYTYTALPNPLMLSASGTPLDNDGNNVVIYYFPYVAGTTTVQNYFIQVYSSDNVLQFSRQAWPNETQAVNPAAPSFQPINQLTNPQFTYINFGPSNSLTVTTAGSGNTTTSIAPGWDLVLNCSAATSVTLTRTALSAGSGYPKNPPYVLNISPGANINTLSLVQTLNQNPNIFAPIDSSDTAGWLSSSVTLQAGSQLSIYYSTPSQTPKQILTANNTSGIASEFVGSTQLDPVGSAAAGTSASIIVQLSPTAATALTSLQIVSTPSEQTVAYQQVTANRELDQMFNYYNQPLQYKPIPSYLIGWDFALNPAQFLGDSVPARTISTNNCQYVWDQTILFSSANTGAAVSRATSGALTVTATNTTQFAIIQYLPQSAARKILNDYMSVNVSAATAKSGGLVGTVSLWYTTGALASASANTSLVSSLDANGFPTCIGWSLVGRGGLGNAQFTVGSPPSGGFNNYGFNGWSTGSGTAANTATYFAIVVGFASLTAAESIDIASVSLVPGNIATVPAPQSACSALLDCQRYYAKSFLQGVKPVENIGLGNGEQSFLRPAGAGAFYPFGNVILPVCMNSIPSVTFYNPNATGSAASFWNLRNSSTMPAVTFATPASPTNFPNITPQYFPAGVVSASLTGGVGDQCMINWTADARLGA